MIFKIEKMHLIDIYYSLSSIVLDQNVGRDIGFSAHRCKEFYLLELSGVMVHLYSVTSGTTFTPVLNLNGSSVPLG
mgnify:CR=1 FL=1